MSTQLKQWIIAATAEEIQDLAEMAGTSRAYLHQLATGHRQASACTAGAIADAANTIRKKRSDLPLLARGDMCEACAGCPHYQSHKGASHETA